MPWRNLGYDVYKSIMGEEMFKQKIEEFEKPLPPPGMFDKLKISYHTNKLKLLFGAKALIRGQRATHPVGVGAEGIATIISNPKFPKHEFFIPGRLFPVCLRHSTIQSVDDVLIDFCGGSLRFAGSDDGESPCDLVMGTGPTTPLWSVQAIYDAARAKVSGDMKTYLLLGPDHLAANIGGLRQKPDSFYDQRYYTEVIFDFKALDGLKRYVRFRLIPADGSPETGLLSEEVQRQPWVDGRSPTETLPEDYLKREYKERITQGPLQYKLQLQLHEAKDDDPPTTLHVGREWDESTHPWLDLADIKMTSLLSPTVTERLRFIHTNLPSTIVFLPAQSVDDPSVVVHVRNAVYVWSYKLRSMRSNKVVPDQMTSYFIRVQTGSQSGAGTNASIAISLTGTKGKTETIPLASSRNDFVPGHCAEYTVQAMDVGEVLMIHLHNDGACSWFKDTDWFVSKITVTSSKQEKTFEFPCYRWLVSDMVVCQGIALLPFQNQPEVMRDQRILEIQQRKKQYSWGSLPAGVTDLPGFIDAPKHGDLPRDAQFSDESVRSFNRGRFYGPVNLGPSYMFTLCGSLDNFDSFKKIFNEWTGDVPQISHDDLWMEDRIFGKQFLNGCNPCVIERCSKLPNNFPVTNEMVKSFLDRGMTLTEEIQEGHVYIVDYKELEGIKRNGEDGNSKLCYTAEPLCLFYVQSSGDLVPIAIQLFQQPSDTNPIWTPDDSQYDWLLAKMWFRNADHQVHQMGTRLMKTHLLVEAFAVASWRQLPSIHPVFKLLFPHLRSVMAINTIGRNELIPQGGVVDKTLSIGGGGHIQLLEKTYKNFKFEMLSLPDMLKKRGVDDIEKLPNYFYRDDGLLMFKAISDFIAEFISIFYHSDDDVSKDNELQSWVMDIYDNGFPVREGDVDHEFPRSLQTRDQLVHLLTCIVFTCSCQHAAVNFPQMEITGFIPNIPPVMRLPPPTRINQATLKSIMGTLPNKSQAGWHVATVYSMTRVAKGERFIGDYSQSLLNGEAVEEAISRFQASLQKISEAIQERNASVEFPYPYLLPERVPNGIGI